MTYSAHTQKRAPFSVYLSTVFVLFFLTLSAADSIGFVPYYIDGTEPSRSLSLASLPQLGDNEAALASGFSSNSTAVETVVRIKISAVGIDLPVQNPATTDVAALDELLKAGPARYALSSQLGESGNMIIFAHSSHLPIVHNQMYKAFNNIPDLKEGDVIELDSSDNAYLYAVTSVRKADVSDTEIDLSKARGTRLTLVTCDTLTGKSARFLAEAQFVGIAPLASSN